MSGIFIGIIFLFILMAVTYRGYIEGPAIVAPLAIAIVVALLINTACSAAFPSLYIPFISGFGSLLGINITEIQIRNASLGVFCTEGIRVAKLAFAGILTLVTAVPSGLIYYKNIWLLKKADSVLHSIVRISGALIMFSLCLLFLWGLEAFLSAGSAYSSVIAQMNAAFSNDWIIQTICLQNPMKTLVANFVLRG